MRLRLEESTEHLSDVCRKLKYIVICDDVRDYHYQDDSIEEQWDESDISLLLDASDEQLSQLDRIDIMKIDNIELLDRLYKIDASKLTKHQIAMLKDKYKEKVIIDKSDVENIINQLHNCDKILIGGYHRKTNDFIIDNDLTSDDINHIIKNLTLQDYVASTRSINLNHFGNNLIIFQPNNITLEDGRQLPNITLYIKIDLDESTREYVMVISIHQAQFNNEYPFRKEG